MINPEDYIDVYLNAFDAEKRLWRKTKNTTSHFALRLYHGTRVELPTEPDVKAYIENECVEKGLAAVFTKLKQEDMDPCRR